MNKLPMATQNTSDTRKVVRLFRSRFTQLSDVSADLVYRGIALCAMLAFLSSGPQITALIGANGILPAQDLLSVASQGMDVRSYWYVPTLFWIYLSDAALLTVCYVGVAFSVIALSGAYRVTAAMGMYVCYLSICSVGQVFYAYQWDVLLLEAIVLCMFLAAHPRIGIWLTRLLLFRFMFLSGAAKLLSGDPTWADGSALAFHFETQPLPTVLGWYAHFLPSWLLTISTFASLLIEIVFPFFIFLGRRFRLLAFSGFVLLELLILATGSYNFFNLLTIVLCISLLDDRELKRLSRWFSIPARKSPRYVVLGLAAVVAVGGALQILQTTVPQYSVPGSRFVLGLLHVPRVVNSYGLFAVMTTQRDEIVWQGSMDGNSWHTYEFPYKPGDPSNAPAVATPHQPRLDWQMWFAALGTVRQSPWAYGFAGSLLRAEESVLGLVVDPFAGEPPKYVRALRYRYEFSPPEERAKSKHWWIRRYVGEWLPPSKMRTPVIRHEPLVIDGV